MRTRDEKLLTAVHEASHVVLVVATIGRKHVGRITMHHAERGRLATTMILRPPDIDSIVRMSELFPRFAELAARHMVAILLAGHVGAHLATRKRLRMPLRGDLEMAIDYLRLLPGGSLQQEIRRIKRVLRHHGRHIHALAAALVARKSLRGKQALAILDSLGPIAPLRRRELDRAARAEMLERVARVRV